MDLDGLMTDRPWPKPHWQLYEQRLGLSLWPTMTPASLAQVRQTPMSIEPQWQDGEFWHSRTRAAAYFGYDDGKWYASYRDGGTTADDWHTVQALYAHALPDRHKV